MTDFYPVDQGEGEFPPINPRGDSTGTTTNQTITVVNSVSIPDGSVTDAKLAPGIDPRKIAGVGIKAYLNAADQAITTGGTGEDITFDATVFNQGFATPAATFTTIAAPYSGIYLIQASVEWATDSTGGRTVVIEVNGSEVEGERKAANNTSRSTVTAVRNLTEGDTIGLHVEQDTGGDLDVHAGEDNCSLSVIFLFSI